MLYILKYFCTFCIYFFLYENSHTTKAVWFTAVSGAVLYFLNF